MHVEGRPFKNHIPYLCVYAEGLFAHYVAPPAHNCIPHAFGDSAILNSETELYLLKHAKELSSTTAPLTASQLPDEVCTLIFYLFLFSFIFYSSSGVYESRNCKFQEHNRYFLQRKHLTVHLLFNILYSFL